MLAWSGLSIRLFKGEMNSVLSCFFFFEFLSSCLRVDKMLGGFFPDFRCFSVVECCVDSAPSLGD